MTITFSPWIYSDAQWLSASTYSAAATVGGWFAQDDGFGFAPRYGYGFSTGSYIPGWANRFFADRAPTSLQTGGYPSALEDRARDYVRKTLNKEWMPDKKRYATGYDAYTTAQHAEISKSEQAAGAEGREKAVWDLADSLKSWIDIGDKRADYNAASDAIRTSKDSASEKLAARVANLLVPGSSEVSKEAAEAAMAYLKPAELPAERTPNAIMAAFIRKLGGETVAQSVVDEVSAQVASRGVPTKGRSEYIADLEKKGLKAPEAAAVYDKLLANKTDPERREALGKMGEVKTDKIDAAEKTKQYDQNARVEAMRAQGVKNEEELRALLEKYKAKKFANFLDAMRKDVASGKIPKAAPARRTP